MKLLPHQNKFVSGYSDKAFIVHEGGTGKTICACMWLRDGRDRKALVICPKRVIKKWEDALDMCDTKATVWSKEMFKRNKPKKWSAIVVDEADEFAAPLFTRGRSQLATALYNQVRKHETPIALCTATPIRSNPWNLHTLLCYLGIYIPWKQWRDDFFQLERRPYLAWAAYFPKKDWRQRVRSLLEQYADIVLLKDCVDVLPPVTESVIMTPSEAFEITEGYEPSALFFAEHKHEQLGKIKTIVDIAKEYRKVLVVAHYVEQVEGLNKELAKDRETFMVHGSVKKQEDILVQANLVDECFLIVQASLGAGFDADSFSCVIFASMSYRARDFVQMKYRVRRIHNLHPVTYYYLIGGRCDQQVYDTIQLGRDFIPSEWNHVTTA